MAKHFHCPVNGWDCPYYEYDPRNNHYCICTMSDPMNDCDNFAYAWEGYEPEDYTDED